MRLQTVSERSVVMSHDPLKILKAPFISQQWLKLELSNFVHTETIAKGMINHLQKGRGYGHMTHLHF